ncbi:MAG: hypothetical protein VX694_11935 [Planctomycetota bacterium]|nr:hypothetical protein [Planctomycetota bacterium]
MARWGSLLNFGETLLTLAYPRRRWFRKCLRAFIGRTLFSSGNGELMVSDAGFATLSVYFDLFEAIALQVSDFSFIRSPVPMNGRFIHWLTAALIRLWSKNSFGPSIFTVR